MSCYIEKERNDWRMRCDVGEATKRLENELCELKEELVAQEKRKKGWRMNRDVGEGTEGLENEL